MKTAFLKLIKITSPFILFALFSTFFYLLLEKDSFNIVFSAMLLYSFPNAFGKETLIPLAIYGLRAVNGDSILNVIIVSFAVSSIDFIYATFMLFNFDYAYKIPIVGKYVLKAQIKGEKTIAQNPWMHKSAFLAIFLYALIPIQGAGGFVSSIVGRIIGLEKVRVWIASSLGSLVGCIMLGLAADSVFATFERNIFQGLELLLFFIVIGVVIYLVYQKYIKKTHVIQSIQNDKIQHNNAINEDNEKESTDMDTQ